MPSIINYYLLQEAVSETLEELWISYNNIEKLKGITVLKNLVVHIYIYIYIYIGGIIYKPI